MKINSKDRKKFRIRNKLKNVSTRERFRLSVSRSAKNISAQIIDEGSTSYKRMREHNTNANNNNSKQ